MSKASHDAILQSTSILQPKITKNKCKPSKLRIQVDPEAKFDILNGELYSPSSTIAPRSPQQLISAPVYVNKPLKTEKNVLRQTNERIQAGAKAAGSLSAETNKEWSSLKKSNSTNTRRKRSAKNVKSYTNLKILVYLKERHEYDVKAPYLKITSQAKINVLKGKNLDEDSIDSETASNTFGAKQDTRCQDLGLEISSQNPNRESGSLFFADGNNPESGRPGASLGDIFGDLILQETQYRDFDEVTKTKEFGDEAIFNDICGYSFVPDTDTEDVMSIGHMSERSADFNEQALNKHSEGRGGLQLRSRISTKNVSTGTKMDYDPNQQFDFEDSPNLKNDQLDSRRKMTLKWALDDFVDRNESFDMDASNYNSRIVTSTKILKSENMMLMSQIAYVSNGLNCIGDIGPVCMICKFPIFNMSEIPFCGCTYDVSGSIFVNSYGIDDYSSMFGYNSSADSDSTESQSRPGSYSNLSQFNLDSYVLGFDSEGKKDGSTYSDTTDAENQPKEGTHESKAPQAPLFGGVFSNFFAIKEAPVEKIPHKKGLHTDYDFPQIIFLANPKTFIQIQRPAENKHLRQDSILAFDNNSNYVSFINKSTRKKTIHLNRSIFRDFGDDLDIQKICSGFEKDNFVTIKDEGDMRGKARRRKSTNKTSNTYLGLNAFDSDDSFSISSYNNTFASGFSDGNKDNKAGDTTTNAFNTVARVNYDLPGEELAVELEEFELMGYEIKMIKKLNKFESQNVCLKKLLIDLYFI